MKRYFVYDLIDPRTDKTFYVGKGCDDRPAAHLREAKAGKPSLKCRIIREILEAGLEVRVTIVRRFKDEKAAYKAEADRIQALGLDSLSNIAPGGEAHWAKSDPDLSMVKVISLLARKTRGLELRSYRFWFAQQWHDLPPNFMPAMRDRVAEIVARRGKDWAIAAFGKHGVTFPDYA